MMKVLRFTSLFFFFHFSAPVAFGVDSRDPSSLSSGKEEDSVSSPRVDFVTQGNGVNGSVVDPQDDGHKSSVQRKLKKKDKKKKSSPMSSPTDSPMSSPTDSNVSSPTDSPVSSPASSPIDLACVDVFTGNRTYIPNCANYINQIIVSCDSEGQCEYFHQSIEFDDDGNAILDEERCILKAEFSYAKVKVQSSQCNLNLEPIPISAFGSCSFSDQGIDYGGPNMLKSEILSDGTMNLIFSANYGQTFFEDIRVANPGTEEETRRLIEEPNLSQTNVCEDAEFVVASFAVGGELLPGRCETDDQCQLVNQDSYCSTRIGDEYPDPNLCYECLNNNHCPANEVCVITNANRVCESPSVRPVPGISSIKRGYNIFKADPLFTLYEPSYLSSRPQDPGDQNSRVFDLDMSDAGNYEIYLDGGEPYYEPIGFEVSARFAGAESTVHNTFENSDSFSKEQGSSLFVSASGTIKGVDLGASVGVGSREQMARHARIKTTTVNANSISVVYEFQLQSGTKLRLTDRVKTDLRNIGNSLDWVAFFEKYGTHLTVGGKVGAWSRQTFRFTETEKSSLSTTSESFETTMSVGIPGIFSLDTMEKSDETKTAATRILSNSATSVTITHGKIADIDKSVLISRTLIPICDQIDELVDKDECYDELIAYCVMKINEIVPGTTECVLGNEFSFQCFKNEDCDGVEVCRGALCVPECRTNSECEGKYYECRSNECKPMRGDPNGCTAISGGDLWSGSCNLQIDNYCPTGFKKIREENGPCWWPTKRWVCERRAWISPPCTRPLKGTCGDVAGGNPVVNRGNGCCADGRGCSAWGYCGTFSQYLKEVNPSYDQCKEMGARY